VRSLAQRLDVDLRRPFRTLSTGNRQKVSLVLALAPDPRLYVLDEPTTGLDPLVQQEFAALVREARADGRTVFLSSHVLSEVSHLADRIGILRQGRLVAVEELRTLRERAAHHLTLRFSEPAPVETFSRLPGVHDVTARHNVLSLSLDGPADAVVKTAARFEVLELTSNEADLEQVFLDYYRESGDAA
jgi:ABC-2 type transport system ATP-binding protein